MVQQARGKSSPPMDIPSNPHRTSRSRPEQCIQDLSSFDCYSSSSRPVSHTWPLPAISTNPMSIPNARDETLAPPPLPPPRFNPELDAGRGGPDIAWLMSNEREEASWGRPSHSIKSGSSLYGSSAASSVKGFPDERPAFERKTGSTSAVRSFSGGLEPRHEAYLRIDEGYASLSGTSIGSNQSKRDHSLMGKGSFQSSMHDQFRNSQQDYDKSQLDRLIFKKKDSGSRGYARPPISSSLNDSLSRRQDESSKHGLKAHSLPLRSGRPLFAESPLSHWENEKDSTTSPHNRLRFEFTQGQFDYRSPGEHGKLEASPLPSMRWAPNGPMRDYDEASNVSASSAQGSHERHMSLEPEEDSPTGDTSGFKHLKLDDRSGQGEGSSPGSTTGQKRRASSPPGDSPPSLYTVGSGSDLFRRRENASRSSPVPRIHSSHGSVSSTASGGLNNSYTSTTHSLITSSVTTMSSHDRLSPAGFSAGGLSPGGPSPGTLSPLIVPLSQRSLDSGLESPYASPRTVASRLTNQRTVSPVNRSIGKHSDALTYRTREQGAYVCQCCPKKPKKFETLERLTAHEQEKQYICQYCKNRFKNKNEAERHQNSLHLRRHSWSCAALSSIHAAFHVSPTRPNEADTCGFCGEEFARTGLSHEKDQKVATDRDWDVRIQHLTEAHKIRECNNTKKFFRADHFRQHLKHSHAGTSGKWTNMLENACMKEEPMPDIMEDLESP